LLLGPAAETRLLVGREVGPVEHAEARNLEAHLRPAERACHVRLAEEVSGRVAIDAAAEWHEVLAARDLDPRRLRPGGRCRDQGECPGRHECRELTGCA